VLARGGWQPRYARVLAVASDGEVGFALVDGNGDGQELEAELWDWQDGGWTAGSSSGAGGLDWLGAIHAGWAERAHFAFGRALGADFVTVRLDEVSYRVPVSGLGIWVFVKAGDADERSELTLESRE